MATFNEDWNILIERAANRIKELDRAKLYQSGLEFHQTIRKVLYCARGPYDSESFELASKLEEYPALLRHALDLRDELQEIVIILKNLRMCEQWKIDADKEAVKIKSEKISD